MKGKHYAIFKRWFEHMHVHEYIKTVQGQQPSAQGQLWTNMVIQENQRGTTLCVDEHCLVVSTLAYSVHNPMADKVKGLKIQQMLESSSSENLEVEVSHTVTVSKVTLHRYGRLALHSMVLHFIQWCMSHEKSKCEQ